MAAVVVLVLGCSGESRERGAAPGSAEDRQEIRTMLERFLPALAAAYSSGDMEPLRPYAVERVLAYTQKRVTDIANQGMVLEANFDGLVIEDLRTWGNDFGIVNTLETWDLTYHPAGGGSVISDRPDTKSRVAYQVKKEGGQWRVFHRELKQELTD